MPPNKVIKEQYWELRSFKNIKLKKPIKVDVIKENGEYILSTRDFNVYAYGENLLEVQEEIRIDMYDLYSSLFLEDKNLGKPMIELKERFKDYLYVTKENN